MAGAQWQPSLKLTRNLCPEGSGHDIQRQEAGEGASLLLSLDRKDLRKPIDHWLALIEAQEGMKHMERVALLKSEHGLGHGHANALVAYVLSQKKA